MDNSIPFDYKFPLINNWNGADRELLQNLRSLPFRQIVEAYSMNMERVRALPMLIADAVFNCTLLGRCTGPYPMITGDPETDLTLTGAAHLYPEVAARIASIDSQLPVGPLRDQVMWRVGSQFFDRALNSEANIAQSKDSFSALANGTDAIMYAVVLNSYAAFESLAGDLWVAAVNANPRLAVGKVGDTDKTIRLDNVKAIHSDLSAHMGDILRDAEKVSFQTLDRIKKAYLWAFGKECKSVFEPESDLYKTSKVRNLIAHKSGKIDDIFRKEMKRFPEYLHREKNGYLFVDGSLASALIGPCVKTACNLVEYVDAWECRFGNNFIQDYCI